MTRYTDMAALRANLSPDVRIVDDARPHPPAYQLTPAAEAAPLEHDEQAALFAWAATNEDIRPELAMLIAMPNGGYRPMATAAKLKAEGVKAGYPDILMDVPLGRYHGLRIELKRADRSNHATDAQTEWIARLRHYGYMAVVAYGCDEAKRVIMAYLAQDEGSAA